MRLPDVRALIASLGIALALAPASSAFADDLPIDYRVQFRYGADPEDPDNKQPVLIYEEHFTNTSKTETVRLSFWNHQPFVRKLAPAARVVTHKLTAGLGKPAPPKPDLAIELAPGQSSARVHWAWPTAEFPFVDDRSAHRYTLKSAGPMTVTLCRRFGDDSEVFTMHLKNPYAPFATGEVCTKPTPADFKILMRE